MADALTCPQCDKPLTPEDSVIVAPDGRLSHLDCREPRALSREERLALICYCSGHAIVQCSSCAQSYREIELRTDYAQGGTHLCPGCHADLTEGIRGHLHACERLPETVREKARASRDIAQRLVKQSIYLRDRADVLMREAEATIAALRDTWRSTRANDPDALRLLVRLKLADGRLPFAGIPPTVPGVSGDGSTCDACDQALGPDDLMMVVATPRPSDPGDKRPVVLHPDCFQIWNQERRLFR
jgi:hypothetical protein